MLAFIHTMTPSAFEIDALPLKAGLLVSLARCWPIRRGRTRLRQLVVRSLDGCKPLVEAKLAASRLRVLAPWADQLGSVVVTFGDSEPEVFRFLDSCVRSRRPGENLFVDVGANLGIFSLRIAERFGEINVIAFEPNPPIAALLRENAARNGLKSRVDVREVALGDRDVSARLQTVAGDSGVSTVTDVPGAGQPVEMRRLSTEIPLADWKRIAALKIDVEGFELGVLKGAGDLFAQHRPVLTYEVNRPELSSRGLEPRVLGDFLRGVGYPKILALGPILYPPENGLHDVCNLVALPEGREEILHRHGFDAHFKPRPESMWPIVHFEV